MINCSKFKVEGGKNHTVLTIVSNNRDRNTSKRKNENMGKANAGPRTGVE